MQQWRKAGRCDSNACTEVSHGSTRTLVRDSTQPRVWLSFSNDDWQAFLASLPERGR